VPSERHIHIVSFNVPYPANYGGVIDVYHKILALTSKGVKVHLHTFHYGREKSPELEAVCESVHYYPRGKFYQALYSSVPYIVGSRQSDSLLANLAADDYPVLFEGLHTCLYLAHPAIKHKLKAVRMHNIEWDYYNSLGKVERNFFRKFYFFSESKKLKQYEEVLKGADLILAISPNDTEYLEQRFEGVHLLPAFHPHNKVKTLTGWGGYALYHGNLSVQENNQAAMFLTRKIFDDLNYPLKVAGKEPLNSLVKDMEKNKDYELIKNPDEAKLKELVANAHINVLPTFQATGIKLKVLNALFNGRHCLVNSIMVQNTGLEELCIVANTAEEMKQKARELFDIEMTQPEIERREKILLERFSNDVNVGKLMGWMYDSVPAAVAASRDL
jgi:hypothetical protein